MMLAARLLCSGERPEALQRLFQAACRFRLCAKDRTGLYGLRLMSRKLPKPTSSVKMLRLSLYSGVPTNK